MKTILKGFLFLFLFVSFTSFAQNTLSGTVLEASTNQPVPGVNILVKNSTKGVTTDFDGNYTLTGISNGDVIEYSFVGLKTQTITYTGQATQDINLSEDASELEAVVVIGYGTTTKKDLTGSVELVSEDDFNKGNNVTAENLLNGRVAGVTINTSGAPGSGSEIRIRGGASLNASNSPLIVIDGLPVQSVAGGSRSILSSINPDDIESFSVLKDASAAAIYGNRGANGVIIITTKKGKSKLQVNIDTQVSVDSLAKKVDIFSAEDFRGFINENFPERTGFLGNANTDWQDEIYRTTFSTQHNASVSGSLFDVLPVRLSTGYADQEGLRKTSEFERTTTSLALNPRFFDNHLKIDFNANLNFEKNRFAPGVEGQAIEYNPTQPVYDANSKYGGFYEYTGGDAGSVLGNIPLNPVAQLLQTKDYSNVRRYYGNFKIDYKLHFLPEVRAVVNLGLDQSNSRGTVLIDPNSAAGVNAQEGELIGGRRDYSSNVSNKLFDGYFVYNDSYGEFNSEITAGYSYQKFEQEDFNTYQTLDPNALAPDTTTFPDIVLLAYFARGNFNYKNKYYLSASVRRDGTSRFGPEERFSYFPAVSGAWQISDEDFLKESNTLSNLKLRVGYGITGQQDITEAFAYFSRYRLGTNNSQYAFGNQPLFLAQPSYRNQGIKWEEITEYNLGLDYGFFDGKISGSLDFFRKESDDLLSQAPIPDGANFSNQGFQNIGKFITQGVEFAVNLNLIDTDDFSWNLNYNTTFIDRTIDRLAFGQDILTGGISGGTGITALLQREGEDAFSYFLYKQLYDNAGNPVEGAYADLNDDNLINNDDKYVAGNGRPDLTMGFLTDFRYKNIDFSFNMRAAFGNEIYNNVLSSRAQYGNVFRTVVGNVPTQILESNFQNTPDVILSDYYLEDGSFLRMDNITLGYTFNKDFTGGSDLRIWTGVQNAFLITDYSGIDPEISNNGIDATIYPRPRTFLFGINYGF
jgi:iron complex outermembrane receptor protein